jgi:hypothetical protein
MTRTLPFALFAAIALIGSPWPALAQSPAAARVAPTLAAKAATAPVRVIVWLALPTVPEAALADERVVAQQRAAIAAAQREVIDRLAFTQSPTRFVAVPAFAITVDNLDLARLAEHPLVASVSEDRRFYPVLRESVPLIRADRLVAQGVDGTGWNIAVLDTGVEKTHSFFAGRVVSEACYSTSGTIGTTTVTSLCPGGATESVAFDSGVNCTGLNGCDHGTLVAGIAAGRTGALAGVARRANLVSIKIFSQLSGPDACGPGLSGPCLGAFESDLVRGLERVATLAAADNAGRIAAVNLSVAGDLAVGACDAAAPALAAAVNNLRAIGIPTVVASGNNSTNGQLAIPACLSSVVSVASSGKTDGFSGFSNRSPMLSLVAPGEHIETSVPGDVFQFATGTSMAAPHVAGAWALLKGILPTVSVDTALVALQRTGVPIVDGVSGASYPRIVVNAAAGSLGPAGSPTSVVASTSGSNVAVSWNNPFDGSVPLSFQIEVALASNAGTIVASLDVGRTYSFGTAAPAGHYLVRVRSMTAAGPGAASNFVPFSIGPLPITSAPDAPMDLRAVVDRQTVALSWNLPDDSATAQSFFVDVGSAPGLSNLGTFDTLSAARSVIAPNVFPGTYFVRVRAQNVIGVSGPSNEVRVYVEASGCAPAPTDLMATVSGSQVGLTWNPPFQGPVLGYTIEVGTASGLSNVASVVSGPQRSASAFAPSGTFFIRVRTRTAGCALGAPSNEVIVVVP